MARITRYYIDAAGSYLGGWQERPPTEEGGPVRPPDFPPGAIEVPTAPADARQVWDGSAWSAVPAPPPPPPTIDEVVAVLEKKGVLTRADVAAEKERGR